MDAQRSAELAMVAMSLANAPPALGVEIQC
jgi:hypothetical protein